MTSKALQVQSPKDYSVPFELSVKAIIILHLPLLELAQCGISQKEVYVPVHE